MRHDRLALVFLSFWMRALAGFCPAQPAEESSSPSAGPHAVRSEEYFPTVALSDSRAEIRMRVGTVEERHTAQRLDPGARAAGRLGPIPAGCVLHVVAVVPDDLEGHAYDFEVRVDGETVHRRSGTTRGFGARSFFVALPPFAAGKDSEGHSLAVLNQAREALYVERVTRHDGLDRRFGAALAPDDFTLALLVDDRHSSPLMQKVDRLLDVPGVRRAISSEIYYAARTPTGLREQMQRFREICCEHKVGFVPITCSWWAGTPQEVKDRLEWQQICWSDSDTYDEGPALRKLLGDKWDIRYGLTVPNMWNSTPWQTMNSPELNQMRRERMTEAVTIIEETVRENVIGYVSENEPAYWAFESSDGKYPVRRKNLWADFNPVTVEAARRDGVVLDPSDGLDLVERIWLHRNLARYMQTNLDILREAGGSGALYSHALLDYTHFPLAGTGHARPYAEVARVEKARVGVEMLWNTDLDALWRVREWGRWACVNREECDGFDIRYHIATLRACYLMGAEMLNSYNWNGMGREGDPVRYFNTFLGEVKSGDPVVVAQRSGSQDWLAVREWRGLLEKNAAFPWGNAIELTLQCDQDAPRLQVWLTKEGKDAVVAYRAVSPQEVSESGPTRLDLGDITQLLQDDRVVLHLESKGGWRVRGANEGPDYRLLCDLKKERRRSQVVIEAARDTEHLEIPLRVESASIP